jgi:hypothetical protein
MEKLLLILLAQLAGAAFLAMLWHMGATYFVIGFIIGFIGAAIVGLAIRID